MQSVVWNEAVKINGADPDFHRRDLWDAINSGDFPGVGARRAALRRRLRRPVRLRRPRRRPRSSPRSWCRSAASAGSCSTAPSTTSSPRPSRWRSAPRTSCPASTSPTTRCSRAATSRTSTPSSSGSAARTSPTCRSTRRSARSPTSSRTATWRWPTPGPGQLRAELVAGDGGGPRGPRAGLRHLRRAEVAGAEAPAAPERFADHYSQARQFFLSQTPVGRRPSFSTRRSPSSSARCETPASGPAWSPTCATSTRTSPGGRRRPRPRPAARAPAPARPPIDDLAPSPALSIVLNGPTASPAARSGCSSPTGDADLELLKALRTAGGRGCPAGAGRPTVGGIAGHDGDRIPADQKVAGGPSVLYDAVALLPSREGRPSWPPTRRPATS